MAYGNSFQRTSPVVLNLIIINALAFFAQKAFGSHGMILGDGDFVTKVDELFALHYHKSQFFKPHQIVTHMFMHGGFLHLIFNMFGLWMFGSIIERLWGPKRFLIFYLICGLSAGLTQMASYAYDFSGAVYQTEGTQQYFIAQYSATVGASGAIMGILAAYGYLFPNTELFIMPIPFPIKAKWAIMGIIAIDVFGGVSRTANDNVAHFAHIGGALIGFLIVLYWNKSNKQTFY